MTQRTRSEVVITILYLMVVAWMITPQATRRLWAMKAMWWTYRRSAQLALAVGRSEMLREASGAIPRYELVLVLSQIRDKTAGTYEKLRAA